MLGGMFPGRALASMVMAGVALGAVVPPSELLVPDVVGHTSDDVPAIDLSYTEFAARRPASVAHLDPDSDEAAALVAAVATWNDGDDEIVVEIVRVADEHGATTFVDQAAATAIGNGLLATEPPFGGAWSYSGGLESTWTNLVSWSQGQYAVTLTQTTPAETQRTLIDETAIRQVEIILTATGAEVSEDAAVSDQVPGPPTDPTVPGTEADSSAPVGRTVVWIVLSAVLAITLVARRRVRSGSGPDATVAGS